jgi:putative hemolysin
LLWHGIWSYVRQHRLDVMIGCASFEGTDPDRLALPLSFLHHYAQARKPGALPRIPHAVSR